MYAIRGAITISENTSIDIKNSSIELFREIMKNNNLSIEDLVSIFFSCTRDITADFPGRFIREEFNLTETAIMHYNEMHVDNSMPLCIRILIHVDQPKPEKVFPVYLRDAKNLRKDLYENCL